MITENNAQGNQVFIHSRDISISVGCGGYGHCLIFFTSVKNDLVPTIHLMQVLSNCLLETKGAS